MFRDNGTLTIGSYIAIINPMPIKEFWCNEVPILEVRTSAFIMKDPEIMHEVLINESITANVPSIILYNNVKINVHSLEPLDYKCGGLFFDRQRAVEIDRGARACGCYNMSTRVGNVVLLHDISFTKDGKKLFTIRDFSSHSFSCMYLKKPFSSLIKWEMLDNTTAFYAI